KAMALQRILTRSLRGEAEPVRAEPPAELDATTPLRLDAARGGWLVESGSVDLFGMATTEGKPTGMRHPLLELSPGERWVAMRPGPGHAIAAVGRPGTRVTPLSAEDLAAWPADGRAQLVDRWTTEVAAALFGEAPAWPELAAEPGELLSVAA